MQHRPEIDGLRTLAVLPVLLFHAGLPGFSGGYVGVDLFFVISGYLITGIILSSERGHGFSLLAFYERRVRRIMPALFLVILACLPFAWITMLPEQMASFGKSLMAVCLFVSNILFTLQTGYFASDAELQPLLHTWSLAVEEQFYVFFPLIMMATRRLPARTRMAILILVAAVSLALAQWTVGRAPSEAFYLPHTRAWELLTGALAAFWMSERNQKGHDGAAMLGLAAIAVSVVAYDASTPVPSLYALLPVLGALAIILFAQPGTRVARLLSYKAMTGIGLISYSLYLWHQPLFAFARIQSPTEPSLGRMLLLTLLAFVLAYLSWRCVEQPFRSRARPTRRSGVTALGVTAASGALVIGIGLVAQSGEGLAFRVPAAAREAAAAAGKTDPVMGTCLFDKGEAALPHPVKACLTPGTAASPTILIGDSHAGAMAGEALRGFSAAGEPLYVMAHSACVGFSGFAVSDPKYHLRCNRFFTGIEDYIARSGIETVIMLSRWSLYVDGSPFDNGEGGIEHRRPTYVDLFDRRDSMGAQDDPERRARVLKAYLDDIRAYLDRGLNVVLIYPVPEAGWNVPDTVARMIMNGDPLPLITTSYARYVERNKAVIDAFDTLQHPRLRKVKAADAFCHQPLADRCLNADGAGSMLYFDDNHISDQGAARLVPEVIEAVKALRSQPSTPPEAGTQPTPQTAVATP
ncbi:hypothetical protein BJF93_00920 [Xaviernesmea oryzae]|uniref:Acyltransferase n=1 Tax=Xaviernesmea oryzae TaxID=464029 RepID=A0A1Q9B0Q6_9HYPH|nr:acyltransferase family protein [Xaviernesmea oryzae]OLP61524.1 hypothetical protein BJF93_00920 [Xaviernesmea oryzae]SEL66511.1 Peptidoglycan/LPS O-acetylase OafA/YrhL, contains acyltransferase and SGNH-hydrolase domains [Xaviernesmea oryzae]